MTGSEQTRGAADRGSADLPDVSEAMATLRGLDERPLAEHLPLLDGAHAALRRALDAPAS